MEREEETIVISFFLSLPTVVATGKGGNIVSPVNREALQSPTPAWDKFDCTTTMQPNSCYFFVQL